MDYRGLISVARGDAPADLVITNARIVNTFTGEMEQGAVAIYRGRIAGVGDYTRARRTIDLGGRFLAPGLIDGHVHLESSYLSVGQYARAVLPRGTTTVVTDLHEVTNVAGLAGMRYIMDCARRVPMDVFFMAPSCIPATPLETSGARLGPEDIGRAMRWRNVLGLGEMMNFPGVLAGDPYCLAKLASARGKPRDGHAPGLRGMALNAYLAPGILSDHETTEYEEGLDKLRRGMFLMIREGSSEKNLEALLPLVTEGNYHRCMLVVDDRSATDILHDGDMDAVLRKAIRLGLDPVRAVQMATLNPARYFGMEGLGGIGPGYWANMIVLGDLEAVDVQMTFYRGKLVAQDGEALFQPSTPSNREITQTVRMKPFPLEKLALHSELDPFPIIEIVPGQITTHWLWDTPRRDDSVILADPERDILKLAVIERHRTTGNIGLGLVKGFGLRRGAMGTSVAHDSHNLTIAGASDEDIYAVAQEIERNGGGLAVALGGKVLASLPLPVAGLLSEEPVGVVSSKLAELERLVQKQGCTAPSPFSILSFLALPVIPELKLSDRGLVDVMASKLLKIRPKAVWTHSAS